MNKRQSTPYKKSVPVPVYFRPTAWWVYRLSVHPGCCPGLGSVRLSAWGILIVV